MKEFVHPITSSVYDISTALLEDTTKKLGAIMIFSDSSKVKKLEMKIKNLENLVNGYLVSSENAIPHDVIQAVTNLSIKELVF